LAWSRSAWAAGGGEERGSGGDKGKFHDFDEVVFSLGVGMKRMPLSRETSGRARPCKAKDEPQAGDYQHPETAPRQTESAAVPVFPLVYFCRSPDSPAMPAAPEADPRFNEFIILQAQNAGLFLGQIPNPHSGQKQINLRAAKSVIDSLEMLASKTAGNLTSSEQKLLATALDNLRPLFLAAQASTDL
jgi:hypothetical protein